MSRIVFQITSVAYIYLSTLNFGYAQIMVFGEGLAQKCYEAAKFHAEPKRSILTCNQALREDIMSLNDRAATLTNRGVLAMRGGYYEKSLSDFKKALELAPEQGNIHLNRGAALMYQGEYEKALIALDTAIKLESKDIFAAYYNRGITHEQLGHIPRAYYDFQKALELRPDWDLAKQQLARFTVKKAPA